MGQKLRAMQGMDQRDQAELTQFGQQLQQAQSAQQVMSQLNNMCFKKCVDKPSASLSSYEKDCIQNCAMRFMDVQKQCMDRERILLRTYAERSRHAGYLHRSAWLGSVQGCLGITTLHHWKIMSCKTARHICEVCRELWVLGDCLLSFIRRINWCQIVAFRHKPILNPYIISKKKK